MTPKQCMLFSRLSKRLEADGYEVFRTTRRYREVEMLLRLKGVDAVVVGKHGGGTLMGKLEASGERILEMAKVFGRFRPDVAVSFSSPEMARVSFGLGVPHVSVNDSPHAEAVARLTIPISERLLTPKMIPKSAWTRYGIDGERIVQYYALDPWAWIKDLKPDESLPEDLGLDLSKPIVTFRTEESYAAYLLHRGLRVPTVTPMVEGLLEVRRDVEVVIVPRYREQISTLKGIFGGRVKVCESVVDGPSLLSYTSVFVGAGGTMSAEAALMGVPTISCYPGRPYIIERYLMKRGLIQRETSPERVVDLIMGILDDLDSVRRTQISRARRLTSRFEDPVEVIAREIEDLGG